MNLIIPDDIVRRAEAGGGDLRLALAIQLYADNRIDHADACRLADVKGADFNRELVTRGISIHLYPAISRIRRKAG
jgi:predicted HTH domain antitoxin